MRLGAKIVVGCACCAILVPTVGRTQLAPVVEVLIVYEANAAAASADVPAEAAAVINSANQALQDSGLAERYRLAALQTASFAIPPGATDSAVNSAMTGSVEIANWRDLYSADLVLLVSEHLHNPANGAPHCGVAWALTNSTPNVLFRDQVFRAAVQRACILSADPNARTVSTHELGHLLYLDHQLTIAPSPDVQPTTPVSYNHPDRLNALATFMVGGPEACAPAACAIQLLHSDPSGTYPGTSLARGHAYDRNDKRMIFETFPIVAAYRNPLPPPVLLPPTCALELLGCVNGRKKWLVSWFHAGSPVFPVGDADLSTNGGTTWFDFSSGTDQCAPAVPASPWIIRARIRSAYGDSPYCTITIPLQSCEDDQSE